MPEHDAVNHPKHYTSHPSGVECIDIVEHMTFNCGNAVKYLWRAGLKDATPQLQDLQKAAWYINREIERLQQDGEAKSPRKQSCDRSYPHPKHWDIDLGWLCLGVPDQDGGGSEIPGGRALPQED